MSVQIDGDFDGEMTELIADISQRLIVGNVPSSECVAEIVELDSTEASVFEE
jgi:hypothetical protein